MTGGEAHRMLVVDPGKMTGWGHLTWVSGMRDSVEFRGGELPHDEFVDFMFTDLQSGATDKLLIEGFTVSQRTVKEATSDEALWSVKQIGVAQVFCRWYHVEFLRQMPSDKSFSAGADKLRKMGWWEGAKGEAGHRRDAARHALLYCTRNQLIDLRRLV